MQLSLHIQAGAAQAFGTALGQLLAVAGLRGPQHLMPWRRQRRHGQCRWLGEQPGQQAVDEQPAIGRQWRIGRQAGHALGAGLVQAKHETLQVVALFFCQHWGWQGVQAKQTGQGGGGHAGWLRNGSVQVKGIDTLACNPLQGHGAVFESGLQ